MTRAQADKLGEKLRKTSPPTESLLEQLQAYRAAFDAPLTQAQRLAAEALGLEATTARIKTINTIVEKLVRSKTRLSTMQDIAGLRIVIDAGLEAQDVTVGQLLQPFPDAKVDDLRDMPRYGYRAVHVVASVDGLRVEIQVRTKMQDLWAQAAEKLADVVGRGIRYGEPPALERVRGSDVAALVQVLQERSADVQNWENAAVMMRALDSELHDIEAKLQAGRPGDTDFEGRRERMQALQLRMAELRAILLEKTNATRQWLLDFIKLWD